ncbi:hypothetical protein QEG60_004085 [Pluralibacter gergoviae]|uniref:hypothetical protein n=1 Tax=Pluralibacter gergoviae TaxID=61647 RepID=UPI000A36F050|nr:hypothetical protein [Pluralibacter gergoviae]EKT9643080.1 hypothetical protein [Pluralibacter gergoviae]EKV3545336.1 hypothetical protein [Pluralibacter gergoviae]EKV9898262.1 hypothetical protein [Pluralibacter gergoviae]EKV9933102.1 hypothetical protein [Pluralibacter gergoviae]EMD1658824.1 hypothetical protein [Pluralibacter gergoviae]
MNFVVDNMMSHDNDNGKFTVANVLITDSDNTLLLKAFVKIPLVWDETLQRTHERLIEEAKKTIIKAHQVI